MNDLTLDSILSSLIKFARELWALIWLYLLLVVSFSGLLLFQATIELDRFVAERTFLLNEDTGAASFSGGLSSALESIPFGIGARNNNNKVIEIFRSNRIAFKVLLDSVEIKGSNDLIANHLIGTYSLNEEWNNSDSIKDYRLKSDSISGLNRMGVKVLKKLTKFLAEGPDDVPLVRLTIDDETDIFHMKANTIDEELSFGLCKSYFDQLSNYYEINKTQRQHLHLSSLTQKTDSVYNELLKYEGLLASASDRSRSIVLNRYKRDELRYMRQVEILSKLYGESIKNTEIARFIYERSIPYFESLDVPMYPLQRESSSKVKAILIGFLLASLVIFIIVLLNIFIREVLVPHLREAE